MVGWIINHLFSGVMDSVMSVSLVATGILSLLCCIVAMVLSDWSKRIPWFTFVHWISTILFVVLLALKVIDFYHEAVPSQKKIEDMRGQVAAKDITIQTTQMAVERKLTQQTTVSKKDSAIDTKYQAKVKQVESVRYMPDLSLANRLMMEIITNFYGPEPVAGNSNAQ